MEWQHIDIHSHLNFSQFDADRDALIAEMKEKGIATICVGTDKKTSKESVELANAHENIFATVGIHPTHIPASAPAFAQATAGKEATAGEGREESFDEKYYESLLGPKVVAVGECGLDYFRLPTSAEASAWQR